MKSRDSEMQQRMAKVIEDMGGVRPFKAALRIHTGVMRPYTAPQISRWRNGRRDMPGNVAEFVEEQYYRRLTPFGSFFLLQHELPALQPLVDLIREGQLEQALYLAEGLLTGDRSRPFCGKPVPAGQWAVLHFQAGLLCRNLLKDLDKALQHFQQSSQLADTLRPEDLPGGNIDIEDIKVLYATNVLTVLQEKAVRESKRTDNRAELEATLASIYAKQEALLRRVKTFRAAIKLCMQHLMRLSSLRGREADFKQWLEKARNSDAFGCDGHARDLFLQEWLSARNDEDGDFTNARSWPIFLTLWGIYDGHPTKPTGGVPKNKPGAAKRVSATLAAAALASCIAASAKAAWSPNPVALEGVATAAPAPSYTLRGPVAGPILVRGGDYGG